MAAPAVKHRLSYAEYLAAEAVAVEKHAFIDGEMYAMSGGTREHSTIQTRLIGALVVALRGRRCVPHGSELRIYLPHLDEACYPDAMVICGPFKRSPADRDATINPTLVCEVLSPSTEGYDRGRKFEKLRGLDTLREYVLFASDRPHVEIFRRAATGKWDMEEYGAGMDIEMQSADVRIAVNDVYEGVFDTERA